MPAFRIWSLSTWNLILERLRDPGDSRSWESPEKEDNVYWLFIQILFP